MALGSIQSSAKTPRAYAAVFAGGVGSRMKGAQIPKQFLQLGGKPIIAHTLQHFQDASEIAAVAVACYEPCIGELKRIVEQYSLFKVEAVVPGGTTGQDSIRNALVALGGVADPPAAGDIVLVHDGVRPLIDGKTISACIASVAEHGCTAVTAPVTETVVIVEDGSVQGVVDRSKCQLARAPQGFFFGELMAVHARARSEGFHDAIDSVSLMARYGHRIYTVPGPEENIKITTQRDFFAFKSFVDMKEVAQIWEP
ncbi:NTP transferase domain-containing protein [Eggerthella lenta]|uniref:IspD/TarI family cytidylyltransferase n=1 Tax=Eggerthella lenta TaxID=84112 RepID=UPI0012ECD38D|nr:IspD/TarI family cytidylyltransferase [Eggerthella lenta]MDB1757337.1 IspD/TarI family cytidylyltransferase [Eggerthella lenta]MDB1765057.1 IspD/TarI family cytidylyltransferase [Eggerthella lenta]MVM50301.1 NTP transferase domain-containing protein [Eggerthella lenta]MVN31118.1 NTP transferase domain-containing protein [Eggerthella lenta]MVN36874.1 NTP transferase domain-containing protein [Eggerthella lenta]